MTINPQTLSSRDQLKKLDPDDVLGSIEALADQVRHAWSDTQQLSLSNITKPHNIVVAGMGGSALGASVIKHLFKDELAVPFVINNDYDLPAFVDSGSLVILSSYSGNTEEILSCANQAKQKKAQIVVICSGGKLAKLAETEDYPLYLINAKYNPSNQPRMAIGYAIAGLMGILAKVKLIKIDDKQIDEVVKTILTTSDSCSVETETDDNPAKSLTFAVVDRRPNLIAAEFLTGAAHVASNQFNENAKTFASYYQVPEMNHHLLESLEFPKSNQLDNIFLFFDSKLYHPQNKVRIKLTQEAVEKQGCVALEIKIHADSKLAQVFELITLASYSNYYLAILNGINPSLIPIVDWFKDKLAKK